MITSLTYLNLNSIKDLSDHLLGLYIDNVYDKIDMPTLADWILEDGLNVKLQMQLHKHIWGEKKGV